ncbi:MAG: hypothetical protein ACR2H2_03820 [Solirubrobacteraceae bacterium]
MIEPIGSASSATSAATTGGTSAATTPTKDATSFAGELARSVSRSASSTKAEPRPDGEQTKRIAGHPYSRIENGADKGMFVNQLASSPRLGSAFRMAERDDRVFHVYGTGKNEVVVEIKSPSQSKGDSTSAPSTAGATPRTM